MPQMSRFAPKVEKLRKKESPAEFESWRENIMFTLTMDGSFEEFLEDNYTWQETSVNNRGLQPDTDIPPGKTAKQKASLLQLMLGSIASYATVISREYIVHDALSLDDIWNRLRMHYGFRKTGALILDLPSFSMEEDESYETLWERYYAFMKTNLMTEHDGITHFGKTPTTEFLTPTLYNTTVVLWLKCIHPGLPQLVKQKFATELRGKSLASLREIISESLDSFVTELAADSEAKINRTWQKKTPYQPYQKSQGFQKTSQGYSSKFCIVCKTADRQSDHFLSECRFLPERDKKFFMKIKARGIDVSDEEEECCSNPECTKNARKVTVQSCMCAASRKVDIMKSPVLPVKYNDRDVNLTLDLGAEANLMKKECAERLKLKILKTSTKASQADGQSSLNVMGEVHLKFTRQGKQMDFNGLVVENLSDDVICGVPFQSTNDVYARPATKSIHVGEEIIPYNPTVLNVSTARADCCKAAILRVPRQTVVYPDEALNIPVPTELEHEELVAVEPRLNCPSARFTEKYGRSWVQPQVLKPTDGILKIVNSSDFPVIIKRHEQIAMVRATQLPDKEAYHAEPVKPRPQPTTDPVDHLLIIIDPDKILPEEVRKKFRDVHVEFMWIFDGRVLGCYNGKSGPLYVIVNMGPTQPPQRKGCMPQMSRERLEEMQRICDELEGTVLVKPEDYDITVEYLNLSFLVNKPSGKKRLVTSFGEVGQYAKPQPALMPNVNQILRNIAEWVYIIITDLTSAYWQMVLKKSSMKYCGIVTPFRGVRAYARGAMGMPGTETALEELMCRILGDVLYQGNATKIADDLYCGGETAEEALEVWKSILAKLGDNGLKLSAQKTVVCPASTTILGWIWEQGTLRASPHKVSALASVELPSTVGQLRSYIGSFKYLSRVIPSHSDALSPLDELTGGRKPTEKIQWTDSLVSAFKLTQKMVTEAQTITIPRRKDYLQIITDASQSKSGISAALYVVRGGKSHIAGHLSAKHRMHQKDWLPCELEALAICTAVTHYSHDIVNSDHQALVLTDSLPCVQAYRKLCQGKFSSSSRVSTFLSVLARYRVRLEHIKGKDNIYSDFASRNPVECSQPDRCQICKFIQEVCDSVVRLCTVSDILNSGASVPYSSRAGWHELQSSCESVRRACAHLKQGTTPSRKMKHVKDVKRYLQVSRVATDGLLVVQQLGQGRPITERIVVPRKYLHALMECIHVKLQHPSKAQLRKVFCRAYYALDLEPALEAVSSSCHTCVSLADMPNRFLQQSTTSEPTSVGSTFSADIVKRSLQCVLVVREYISSYTYAKEIADEKADTIRSAILIAHCELHGMVGPRSVYRVDPASSMRSLVKDRVLEASGIAIELGREKFKNHNPVAERAIRELHAELNRLLEVGAKITPVVLAKAIASINSKIRQQGLSAREIYTQRDQYTGNQLPMEDRALIQGKKEEKLKSHQSSAKFKARGKSLVTPSVSVGQLVYINSDREKTKPRERYIVREVGPEICKVQKFVGSQLRSRIYDASTQDITTVPAWGNHVDIAHEVSSDEESVASMDTRPVSSDEASHSATDDQEEDTDEDVAPVIENPVVVPENPVVHGNPVVPEDQPRRSGRRRQKPAHHQDYVQVSSSSEEY